MKHLFFVVARDITRARDVRIQMTRERERETGPSAADIVVEAIDDDVTPSGGRER